MKAIKLIPLALLIFSFSGLKAQHHRGEHHGGKKEKMDAMRVGFITQHLDLTTEEAQKFWPVHNEFRAEMDKIHEERRAMHESIDKAKFDEMSDADIKKMMDKNFELDHKELAIKEKYHKKFLEVLPTKKVAKLYHAEERFKRELLQRMKGREREDGGRRHDGRGR